MAKSASNKADIPGLKLGDTVVITQVRSDIARPKDQRATLKTMGLGRIGHSTSQPLNASLYGKLRKVWHMVEVSKAD
ncbi:MAG TPA: 50S ribosomal protein L30 [Oligoflexia bacterium]|nr:50S ribosomal protein L30 [Oligoflexia bacterium]HMP49801.1 50S ribosomal protein L30 [Oligoflexia bacterium]